MLTQRPTKEKIEEWKRLYRENKDSLAPNRVTGEELDSYFRSRYQATDFPDEDFRLVVETNILANGYFKDKLPEGARPDVRCYRTGDALVGIDLKSSFFHVECADFKKMEELYDDLFLFRGLDETDLKNYFLVAQYVLLKR